MLCGVVLEFKCVSLFYEGSDFGSKVWFVFFNVTFWDEEVGRFLDCVDEMFDC